MTTKCKNDTEVKRTFVNNNVYACVTDIVEYILSDFDRSDTPFSIDDIENMDNAEDQDIFEWYIVSSEFADWLADNGEPVIRNCGIQNYWGRTTSGQAIHMDFTISEVCEYYNLFD